jgi:hypothetical protein
MLVFLIIAYVFSSTRLEKRAEWVLPGSEVGDGGEEGSRRAGGRYIPYNVCTYE